MKRLYLIVNEDRFFLSHRKDIALAAYEVVINITNSNLEADYNWFGNKLYHQQGR